MEHTRRSLTINILIKGAFHVQGIISAIISLMELIRNFSHTEDHSPLELLIVFPGPLLAPHVDFDSLLFEV